VTLMCVLGVDVGDDEAGTVGDACSKCSTVLMVSLSSLLWRMCGSLSGRGVSKSLW
jgi:exosome complex RNA-binding protein Csl4